MSRSERYLRDRRLDTFANIDQVTDLIHALRDPPGEEGPGWNSVSDCRGVDQPRHARADVITDEEVTPGARVGRDSGPECSNGEDARRRHLIAERIDWNDPALRMGGRLGDECQSHFIGH